MTDNLNLEKATAIVTRLEEKRAECIRQGTDLADERANVALAAHTGDTKAAKRLQEIHQAIATHSSELASIDAALRAAGDRVERERQAVEGEAARANAVEIRKLLASFVEAAKDCDALLADFNTSVDELRQALSAIHARGVAFPTHTQLQSLGKYCLLTALNKTPWSREFEIVAPGQRREFAPLVSQWVETIERNHIAPLLDPEQAKGPTVVAPDAKERRARARALLGELAACGPELDIVVPHPDGGGVYSPRNPPLVAKTAALAGSLLTELKALQLTSLSFPSYRWESASKEDLRKALIAVMHDGWRYTPPGERRPVMPGQRQPSGVPFGKLFDAWTAALRASLGDQATNETGQANEAA
jgi:hypothetical protein